MDSIKKSVELHQEIYCLFWNRENARSGYNDEVFESFDKLTLDVNKLYFSNANIYF